MQENEEFDPPEQTSSNSKLLPPPPVEVPPSNFTAPPPIDVPPSISNKGTSPPNCPPGLQYLAVIDQLLVHQQIELLEVITGFETENKYRIRNTLGQDVYFAAENSGCCDRYCCGPLRPFDLKIFDNFKNEVINLNRPLACQGCCFPCCLQSLEVSSPPGTVIGTVEQDWSVFYPSFSVKNAHGDVVFKINGPLFTCSCGGDVNFEVTTVDGRPVGKIAKQWSGFAQEAFTDADNFCVSFPVHLDVKMKAVLLGALFLIDFMYYEKSSN